MQIIFKNKIKIPIIFLVFVLLFTFFIQTAKAALPSEDFLSYPNLADLRRSIDLEFGSGAINTNNFLEKFGQIGGTLQTLNAGYSSFSPETGSYTSVSNMINHLGGLDKLNTISDIITRVINMGGTSGDLLFQVNNIRTWLNVVNSLENLETVSQMMVDLNNLGAEFDDLFGPNSYGSVAGFLVTMNELENIESVSQSIGAFVGQPGSNLTNILNTFGGNLSELIETLNRPGGEQAVPQILSQVVGDADRENRDEAADEQEIKTLEELQKEDAIECKQEYSTGGLSTGSGGGLYVPTQEQEGPLLSSTLGIEDLLVEVCTYTKTTKRIQQAMERQEFGLKPKLRRDAATATENFRQDIDDITKTGFDVDGDGTGNRALFVKNIDEHLTNVVEAESTAVFLDDLRNSDDVFKEETALAMEQKIASKPLESTITKEEYQSLMDGTVSLDNYWETRLKAVSSFHPNNPLTSRVINEFAFNLKVSEDKSNAENQILSSGGWLPIRDCKELTSDGTACREWEVVTPATNVRLSSEEVLVNQLNRYLDPEPGDVAPGNEPKAQELLENRVIDVGGGGTGGANLSFNGILNLILDLFGIGFEF